MSLPNSLRGLFAWLRARPYSVLATLLLIALAVPFLRKHDSQWDTVYLRAAERLQAGEEIYLLEDGYLYPPFMAWLAIPFTALPVMGSRLAWYLVNVLCLVLIWRWAWRLSGGTRLQGGNVARAEHVICILGLLCAFRFGMDALQNQQTDLVITALLFGGCLALVGERPLAAATCFGLAAGMKCTALLWLAWFLWRSEWWAAGWLVVVAVGVNLLPNLAGTAPSGGWWLAEYGHRYLAMLARPDYQPGVWGSAILLNQSLAGAFNRWLLTEWQWTADGWAVVNHWDAVNPLVVKACVYGSGLLLVLVTAWAMGRRPRGAGKPADRALEYGCVLLLMVLLSPMSSKPHFATLLLPAFCLARRAVTQGSRVSWLALLLAIGLCVVSTKDVATPALASFAMWHGAVSGVALALLAGCWHALRNPGSAAQVQPAAGPQPQRLAA